MKRKHTLLRLCLTLTLGAIMALAMSATAFATADSTLTISKDLVVKNATLTSVKGPGVNYSYEITSPTVTAGTDVSGTAVQAGPADGLTIASSPSFAVSADLTASSAGTANTANIVLNVDLNKFSTPGIYRYKLSDTTTGLADIGIVRAEGFNADRYIDVYVALDNGQKVVSGYVVMEENGGDYQKSDYTGENPTKPSYKGLASDSSTTWGGTSYTADVFDTVNVTVSNTVAGNMGDRTHQFEFAGAITGNNGRQFYVNKGSDAAALNQSTSAVSTTLANGETYTVSGLATTAEINWTETNNTNDTYLVKINNGEAASVAKDGTKALGATAVTSALTTSFTNTLDQVSPTGIIFRYGAPILLILAALAVFVIIRRSRKEAEDLV